MFPHFFPGSDRFERRVQIMVLSHPIGIIGRRFQKIGDVMKSNAKALFFGLTEIDSHSSIQTPFMNLPHGEFHRESTVTSQTLLLFGVLGAGTGRLFRHKVFFFNSICN
jgi:hypothetical protein